MFNTILEYVAGIFLFTYVFLFIGALIVETIKDFKYYRDKYFKKS